ncbi:hypothetical protein KFU94_24620 [Chloroflexi bacterium TSY]|nr:hypothetical protein [Chloroflexi bacterium TSY]
MYSQNPRNFSSSFGQPAHPVQTSPSRQAGRSFYWAGFVLGLLLTAILSCGGLAFALGLDTFTLADIQGSKPSWTPPAATPTQEIAISASNSQQAAQLQSGGTFQVGAVVRNVTRSRVRIRQSPGHLGKPGDDIIALIQPGMTVQILDGFIEANNLKWWYVRHTTSDGREIDGWVAEATPSGVTILNQ